LLGEPWVLFRAGGRIRAFVDRCPHRHAPLSLGSCDEDLLRCAYHGWRYNVDGRCTDIPAAAGSAIPPAAVLAPAAAVAERLGMVFLAPEPPITPLPEIPEADDPAFSAGDLPSITTRASAGLLADNFLDMAHFPFVHRGTFGADEAYEVPDYQFGRNGWRFTAECEHPFANREDPAVRLGERPLVQTRRLAYRYCAPFHLVLRIDFVEAGGTNVIGFFIQPETGDRCRLHTTLWRNDLDGDPGRMAEAVAFELAVLEEDLAIQQAFDTLSLPLDAGAEVHTRADRITLHLRRVLADLVGPVDPGADSLPAPLPLGADYG
jgi:vanillate O-demethylase monooxygenase subunit